MHKTRLLSGFLMREFLNFFLGNKCINKPFHHFFAYGEYEYMNTQAVDSTSDVRDRQWVSTLQLGVGRKFSIHPMVQGQVVVVYNFLHDPARPVYPRPWSIRVGFSLSELAMLKR